jgi:hypothetical protein
MDKSIKRVTFQKQRNVRCTAKSASGADTQLSVLVCNHMHIYYHTDDGRHKNTFSPEVTQCHHSKGKPESYLTVEQQHDFQIYQRTIFLAEV